MAEEIPKGQFHYKIEQISPAEFSLNLKCNIEGLLKMMFAKAKALEARSHELPTYDKFEVQPMFYNLVKSILYSKVMEIAKECAKDKIKILTFNVIDASFIRQEGYQDRWLFSVDFRGDWQDDRTDK